MTKKIYSPKCKDPKHTCREHAHINVPAFKNWSFKYFPEHPEIKQRIKTPPLTAQWRLERFDLWLNYCSSNFKKKKLKASPLMKYFYKHPSKPL